MFEDWIPWLVLALSLFVYGIMTLTLSVLQPQGLAAMLGMASTESSDLNPGSTGDYRATRTVVTTVRSASFISIVISGYRAAETTFSPSNEMLLIFSVAGALLISVIAIRMVLNRMVSGCYEGSEDLARPCDLAIPLHRTSITVESRRQLHERRRESGRRE